jgi:large subunit ribosomal protein L18
MAKSKLINQKRERSHKRQRSRIKGTKECPRISVFRSNKHIVAQLINDQDGKTLIAADDLKLKIKKTGKIETAFEVGKNLGEGALKLGIKSVVFDKGWYKYHGRVKSLAEGARKAGLKF